uniref:Small integral membrane protein 5 n=1 Tax=Zosterops lateralis melanops TaxID=1220523 RepID=A0A8D2PTN9_ZOSLA
MSSEGFLKEVQDIGAKFLHKLQKLPSAEPVEIASFFVVLLFIGDWTLLPGLEFSHTCCFI